MAAEIVIPKLGMTMEEGTLASWIVADGTEVQAGQPVFNLETEKIEMEVEAEAAGTVRHVAEAGSTLATGTVVGYILAAGEDLPSTATASASAAPAHPNGASAPRPQGTPAASGAPRTLEGGRVPSSPIARRLARQAGIDIAAVAGSGPGGRVVEADILAAKAAPPAPAAAAPAPPPPAPAREVLASPLARRLAGTLGVDLSSVTGTGPGGRITKEDVEAASTAAPAPAAQGAADGRTAAAAGTPGERIPVKGMRKVIARRMHESLQEMAQLTMSMDVAMDEAIKLRAQLVDEWAAESVRPTYTDLIIKAAAKALRLHPRMNAQWDEAEITLAASVHVGVAVALDEGLVVPVVRDADTLTVKQIAAESARLATAARENKLLPDDMAGQTFSITTLGAAGIDVFTPIINPPNAGILGVGRIRDVVAWDGDRPVRASALTLSLTIDHRVIDGAPAAAFLGTVRDLLEAPYRLLV